MEYSRAIESWLWTRVAGIGVVAAIDDDTSELIARLFTRIGMDREDAGVMALTLDSMRAEARKEARARLIGAVEMLDRLVRAAETLEG